MSNPPNKKCTSVYSDWLKRVVNNPAKITKEEFNVIVPSKMTRGEYFNCVDYFKNRDLSHSEANKVEEKMNEQQTNRYIYAPNKKCNAVVRNWLDNYVKDPLYITQEELENVLKRGVTRKELFTCLDFFRGFGVKVGIPDFLYEKDEKTIALPLYQEPWSPSLKKIRMLVDNLNENKPYPKILTDKSFSFLKRNAFGNPMSILDQLIFKIDKRFSGDEEKFNLLFLESELPCKQQQFQFQFDGITNGGFFTTLKERIEQYNRGDIDDESMNQLITNSLDNIVETFANLHQDWDGQNLIYKRGVPISFKPTKDRKLTQCSDMMRLVDEALDAPENKDKDPKQIQIDLWKEMKEHIDSVKSQIESRRNEPSRLVREAEKNESNPFSGLDNPPEPTGQGRTRRRRRKGNKTKARKVKRKGSRR
jgi:hypothetical protein